MQLSQPGVGHGVLESPVDSGKAMLHPIKRARTTFTYLAVALWGTEAERGAYRKAVNRSHAQVRSTENSPVKYNAFDPSLQMWVAACLYHGLEDVHRALYPDVNFRGEGGIYEGSHTMGTTLQVPLSMWPADRDAFEVYWKEHLDTVRIDEPVRKYLTALTDMTFLPWIVQVTAGRMNHFFTVGFLPPTFREAMQFSWTDGEQRRFDAIMRAVGVVNRITPRPLRVFPYNAYLVDFRRRLRKGSTLV
jgi:uncharacterized protein (DUF2236 family)